MSKEEKQKAEAKFREKYGFFPSPTGAAVGVLVEAADDVAGRMTDKKSGLD
jgi:hypothetical protein